MSFNDCPKTHKTMIVSYIVGRFRLLTSVPCKRALTNISLRLGIRLFVSQYEPPDINILITIDKFIVVTDLFIYFVHREYSQVEQLTGWHLLSCPTAHGPEIHRTVISWYVRVAELYRHNMRLVAVKYRKCVRDSILQGWHCHSMAKWH